MVGNRLLLVYYCLLHSVINDFLNTNFLNYERPEILEFSLTQVTVFNLVF